jgi:hypothetical protein
VLNILSKDSDEYVRMYVAINPNTPVEVLNILSKDSYDDVRGNVARNPNTPVETFNILSKDSDSYVRRYVARNPNTPVETLNILSKDSDHGVRGNVAGNPNTPVEALNILSKDSYEYVRETAKQNPKWRQPKNASIILQNCIKYAQQIDPIIKLQPAQKTAYKNHVIRLNQQAHILADAIKDGIATGSTKSEAKNHADSLRNIAVRYTGLTQQDSTDTQQLKELFKNMMQAYDILARNYVSDQYDPMKKMRESLYFIGGYGPIKMFPTTLPAPGIIAA